MAGLLNFLKDDIDELKPELDKTIESVCKEIQNTHSWQPGYAETIAALAALIKARSGME